MMSQCKLSEVDLEGVHWVHVHSGYLRNIIKIIVSRQEVTMIVLITDRYDLVKELPTTLTVVG